METLPGWLGARYEYDPAGKKTRALTQSTQWDVRWPGKSDQGRIVYETDGELHVVDVKSGASKRIRIDVPSDQLASRPSQMNAGGQIAEYDLSPKGERAIFVARGDAVTAPIEKGAPRNLTEDRFLGQGRPAVGADRGRPFAGAGGRRGARPDVRLRWSPDSAWVAYSLTGKSGERSIWIWSEAGKKARRVTQELCNETNPAWDSDGQYLFFRSDREFAPLIGQAEFNYAVTRATMLFALALRMNVPHPFPPESDEVAIDKGETKAAETKKGPLEVKIDFEGIKQRVARVPLAAGNYGNLSATKGFLVYSRAGNSYYGRELLAIS